MVLRHSTHVILLSLCAYGLLVVLGTDGELWKGVCLVFWKLSTAFHNNHWITVPPYTVHVHVRTYSCRWACFSCAGLCVACFVHVDQCESVHQWCGAGFTTVLGVRSRPASTAGVAYFCRNCGPFPKIRTASMCMYSVYPM